MADRDETGDVVRQHRALAAEAVAYWDAYHAGYADARAGKPASDSVGAVQVTASGVPADVHERAVEAAADAVNKAAWPKTWGSLDQIEQDARAAVAAAAPVLAEPYRAEIEWLRRHIAELKVSLSVQDANVRDISDELEAAEATVQRVREQVEQAKRRANQSFARDYHGNPFESGIRGDAILAALDRKDGNDGSASLP